MLDSERDRILGDWLAAHEGILFKVVRAFAFERADRQEVAIRVWRSVDAYRGESSVPTWMYRIALNAAVSWTRKEDRHQRGKQALEIVNPLLTETAVEVDPRLEWLYRQIALLKDVDRSVAVLMLDGFAYREIAAIVGISEGNVAVKINRIKAALSAQLATCPRGRPRTRLVTATSYARNFRASRRMAVQVGAALGAAQFAA